jgi:uncharacterized protein (TIGR02687 family)
MSERITQSLQRLFDETRIVFWYDTARDMRGDYEAVDLPGVVKLEVANTEFAVKYRVLRQEKGAKFLLYHAGPRPADADNWLLDLLLAGAEFKSDQVTMWLAELGLELAFAPVIRDHAEFFKAKGRVETLKKIRKPTDTPSQLRLRMIAVCAAASGLDTVIEALLAELAHGRDEALKLIDRCGLGEFLWKQIASIYGYSATTPEIEDFALTLFKACYAMGLSEDAKLNPEAMVLFRRWKNDKSGAAHFETLSKRFEGPLAIKADAAKRDFRDLMEVDVFEEVDRHIIRKIVQGMAEQTVTPGEVLRWVQEREVSHWFDQFTHIYAAMRSAAEFFKGLSEITLGMTRGVS